MPAKAKARFKAGKELATAQKPVQSGTKKSAAPASGKKKKTLVVNKLR